MSRPAPPEGQGSSSSSERSDSDGVTIIASEEDCSPRADSLSERSDRSGSPVAAKLPPPPQPLPAPLPTPFPAPLPLHVGAPQRRGTDPGAKHPRSIDPAARIPPPIAVLPPLSKATLAPGDQPRRARHKRSLTDPSPPVFPLPPAKTASPSGQNQTRHLAVEVERGPKRRPRSSSTSAPSPRVLPPPPVPVLPAISTAVAASLVLPPLPTPPSAASYDLSSLLSPLAITARSVPAPLVLPPQLQGEVSAAGRDVIVPLALPAGTESSGSGDQAPLLSQADTVRRVRSNSDLASEVLLRGSELAPPLPQPLAGTSDAAATAIPAPVPLTPPRDNTGIDGFGGVSCETAAATQPPQLDVSAGVTGAADQEELIQKRKNIVQELLQTERDYVHYLETVTLFFRIPMEAKAREKHILISDEEISVLFGHFDVIIGYNKQLLEKLESRLCPEAYDCHSTTVGDVFMSMVPFFRMYSNYCINYPRARAILRRLDECATSAQHLRAINAASTGKLGLKDYLIMPVQRIPRYIMLVSDLRKKTWPGHPDYELLMEAKKQLQDVADSLEQAQETSTQQRKMMEIQKELIANRSNVRQFPSLMELLKNPNRIFVREDTLVQVVLPAVKGSGSGISHARSAPSSPRRLQAVVEGGGASKSERHVWLFTDMMVIAKRRASAEKTAVKNVIPFTEMQSVKDSGQLLVIGTVHREVVLECPSMAVCKQWTNAMVEQFTRFKIGELQQHQHGNKEKETDKDRGEHSFSISVNQSPSKDKDGSGKPRRFGRTRSMKFARRLFFDNESGGGSSGTTGDSEDGALPTSEDQPKVAIKRTKSAAGANELKRAKGQRNKGSAINFQDRSPENEFVVTPKAHRRRNSESMRSLSFSEGLEEVIEAEPEQGQEQEQVVLHKKERKHKEKADRKEKEKKERRERKEREKKEKHVRKEEKLKEREREKKTDRPDGGERIHVNRLSAKGGSESVQASMRVMRSATIEGGPTAPSLADADADKRRSRVTRASSPVPQRRRNAVSKSKSRPMIQDADGDDSGDERAIRSRSADEDGPHKRNDTPALGRTALFELDAPMSHAGDER